MRDWQFNVLFFVGVGGAVLLLLGPELGLKVGSNPTAITGVGAILTYILTQKKSSSKKDDKKSDSEKSDESDNSEEDEDSQDREEGDRDGSS